jgi:hypothetical protein
VILYSCTARPPVQLGAGITGLNEGSEPRSARKRTLISICGMRAQRAGGGWPCAAFTAADRRAVLLGPRSTPQYRHIHPKTTTATRYTNALFQMTAALRSTVLIVVTIVGLASAAPLSSDAKSDSEGCCAQVNGVCCPAGNACEQAGMPCETSCCTDAAAPAMMSKTQAKSDSEGCCAQVNGVCCPAGNACEQAGMPCETSCCTDATPEPPTIMTDEAHLHTLLDAMKASR